VHLAQFGGDTGHLEDIGKRACKGLRVARDDQQVGVGRGVDRVVGEVVGERAQHRGDQADVDLVELEPLHHDTARVQIAAHVAIELGSEKARDAAHPRVGGLAHDDVVALIVGREVGLRVVEDDAAARVGERAGVARGERRSGFQLSLSKIRNTL